MPAAIQPSVLIINACVEAMQATASILRTRDYQIAAATNPCDAHQLATAVLLDLVLLDVSVIAPGQQLAPFVAALHAVPGREDVPILITSSRQRSSVIRRMQPWGATYHVQLPTTDTVLLDLVDRSIDQSDGAELAGTKSGKTKSNPRTSIVPVPHLLSPSVASPIIAR